MKDFLLGVVVRSFFVVVTDSLEFALFGLEPTFAVRNARIFQGSLGLSFYRCERDPSEHGDLCNEHTKGQQRAVSSTFRVLTQAQYQTRAVAAKKALSKRLLKFHLGATSIGAADQSA